MQQLPMMGVHDDAAQGLEAFTFGEPESVLDRRELLDMAECWHNGRWYEPPVSRDGLARAFRVSAHHSSAILLKRNLLVASLEPTPYLSRATFAKAVQDYLVFGDAYLTRVTNRLGGTMRLDYSPAKYTRRGVAPGAFFYVPGYVVETEFPVGSVIQVLQPDLNQEIYGVPEYISALQSALLNEAATLFRRRYYLNGSHAGFILYATGGFAEGDIDKMREALKASKGPGNFRNMFVHAPDGKEHGIKIVPIAEVGAKDEFLGIKNATQADVLAAHRVPPQLLGIVPAQGSAFGNPTEAKDTFFDLEIEPLQSAFLEVNDRVGVEAVRYRARVAAAAA
ncbi:phage portal protein [Sphingomonas oligophenolica]|uniref:Phage portal protein n=1 Tax=Sphingomonas oligophenolica TaxID=301154 RepID=A0A502CMC8_9SPHN|nr:phage portal protein [Sphingomonas oligophenolica]TPG14347.1 phage portal protein [Sphingomonas oligophenolica]